MARLFIISLLSIFIFSCGENNHDTKPQSNDLNQLENDWMQAMMKRDQLTLNQLVASEFTMTGMKYIDSAAVTRSVWMHNTLQDLRVDSFHFIKTKVNTIGDVGIVKAYFYWSGSYDEDRFSDSTSFVDTWIRNNGDWRVVSRIITDCE